VMLLPAKQVIRFRGRDGEARAARLADELHGRCKVRGHEVELTEDTEFGPRLFPPVTRHVMGQFTRGDFR
jgi:hypothetical protein